MAFGDTNGEVALPVGSSLSRLRYFFGQLLTQKDLDTEQRFHLLLQRLSQREAFGTGTVAGLEVTTQSGTMTAGPRDVFLLPGLGFDPAGRELLIEQPLALTVADPPLAPGAPFSPVPGTTADLVVAVRARFPSPSSSPYPFDESDLSRLVADLFACGRFATAAPTVAEIAAAISAIPAQTVTLTAPEVLRDFLFERLIGVTYVGLRFRETASQPAPAVLDASCCGDAACFPTRLQEGVFVVASASPFPDPEDPYKALKLCLDETFFAGMGSGTQPAQVDVQAALCHCLLGAWRGVPPLGGGCDEVVAPVVPLAEVCWSRYAEPTTQILHIDNCSRRPLAPGGPAIRAMFEALTAWSAPVALPPRLISMTPDSGASIVASQTGSAFKLSATANAALEMATGALLAESWEIVFYPPTGTTPTVYTSTSVSFPGGASSVTANIVGADTIELSFPGASAFAVGTYVWRLNKPTDQFARSADPNPGAALDGEPNPPSVVPTGDGLAGGVFEARFVVTNG